MCSLINILQWKKNQKYFDDFWHRKLTLKVKFWYFLTALHYSNFQNLVISFEYSWFLAKNLSNFVSLPWKLHNRYCHNLHTYVQTIVSVNQWFFRITMCSTWLIITYCSPNLSKISIHCIVFWCLICRLRQ